MNYVRNIVAGMLLSVGAVAEEEVPVPETGMYTYEQMQAAFGEGYLRALADVYQLCSEDNAFILGGEFEEKEFLCVEKTGQEI